MGISTLEKNEAGKEDGDTEVGESFQFSIGWSGKASLISDICMKTGRR